VISGEYQRLNGAFYTEKSIEGIEEYAVQNVSLFGVYKTPSLHQYSFE